MAMKNEVAVYKPKGSETYHCRVSVDGVRKSRSTGCADKRDAQAWAKRWKASRMKEAEEKAANPVGQMRFLNAVNLYMADTGDSCVSASQLERDYNWLVDEIGENTPLADITNVKVAELMAKRMSMHRFGRAGAGYVSRATAQLTVVDKLQAVCTHAKDRWEVTLPNEPRWSKFRGPCKPRKRCMSYAEEAAIFAVAGDLAPLLEFSLLSGVRRADALIEWQQVDWGTRRIKMVVKDDKQHEVVITKGIRRVLESVRGHHDKFVFTNRYEHRERGTERVPVSYDAYDGQFRKVCRRAGVVGLCLHDLRRTAGERMYRTTGDIAAVSKFLGHANIETTRRHYVHVVVDDVAERMIAMENARAEAFEELHRHSQPR